jgi:hypothetical protein
MPKSGKVAASPFDALIEARKKPSHQSAVQTSKQLNVQPAAAGLAKSADPDYLKFTTYIRKKTHRAVKVRLTEQEREFSDLVEELLAAWLQSGS